jgi:alkanesulfonate monooxygenase SsuD/methylene tetrahydromethanopterin reductase-like flavin-dependent oxidoreductase (luciferase family)
VDSVKKVGFVGTPGDVVEQIEAYRAIGASRLYPQILDLDDLAHLALIADEVAPHL